MLTDGGIIYDDNGIEYKRYNVKDGQIISHLKKYGFVVGTITGRESDLVRCGLSATPNDAREYIKDKVDIMTDQMVERERFEI